MRRESAIAPDWWDYTTLDPHLIEEAARLTPRDLAGLSRPGFAVILYDTLEEFFLARRWSTSRRGARAPTTTLSASAAQSVPRNSSPSSPVSSIR